MLALGAAHPFRPAQAAADRGRARHRPHADLPAPDEFDAYAREHPLGGMPYGTGAARATRELGVLARWVAAGAAAERPDAAARRRRATQVASWETFLNGDSLKERIIAPLPLRALVRRAPVLRRPAGRPVLPRRALAHAAGRADRRDRDACGPTTTRASRASGTGCGRSTRRSCTRRTSSTRSAPPRCAGCAQLFLDAPYWSRRAARATTPRRRRTRSSRSPRSPAAPATSTCSTTRSTSS